MLSLLHHGLAQLHFLNTRMVETVLCCMDRFLCPITGYFAISLSFTLTPSYPQIQEVGRKFGGVGLNKQTEDHRLYSLTFMAQFNIISVNIDEVVKQALGNRLV
jgi:hypothetical protein